MKSTWRWTPYNDGLPLVNIKDPVVDPAGHWGRHAPPRGVENDHRLAGHTRGDPPGWIRTSAFLDGVPFVPNPPRACFHK